MKTCNGCKTPKPLDEFHGWRGAKDGRQMRCKACQRARNRTKTCKDVAWKRLNCQLSHYALTLDQYHSLCESQDWQCAICDRDFDGKEHIDHSHTTGRVRGILCAACNTAIGKLKENVDAMHRAIAYVSRRGLTPRQKGHYVLLRYGPCSEIAGSTTPSVTGPDSSQAL